MSCAFRCHEVGGPYISENPNCPIHGSDGVGYDTDEMRQVIRELTDMLDGYLDPEHITGIELIQRARNLIR